MLRFKLLVDAPIASRDSAWGSAETSLKKSTNT